MPRIRGPKVHNAWNTKDRSYGDDAVLVGDFLTIQYIPGKTLRSVWPLMGPETRAETHQQLPSSIEALR